MVIRLKRLDEAISWIEAHPEEHDQRYWLARTRCGTTACLAGVLALRDGWVPVWGPTTIKRSRWGEDLFETHLVTKGGRIALVINVASEILGIDDDQQAVDQLF